MYKLAYININCDVTSTKMTYDNKILFVITKNDYKKNRFIDIDKVISDCKMDMLIKYFNDNYKEYDEIELDGLKNMIKSYFKGLQDSFKTAFNNNIIDNIIVFYPFFRISNVNGKILLTYFLNVNYFNNKKEFWITEAVPDVKEINESKESFNTYINNLFFNVRNSILSSVNIYNYCPNDVRDKIDMRKNFITFNYILEFFIKLNFGLNISKVCSKISVSSLGELILNNNKRKNKKRDVYLNEETLLIAIKDRKLDSYFEYAELTIYNLYFYGIVRTTYNVFIKLNKKRHINDLDEARKLIVSKFLYKIISKENITFTEDINILIRKGSNNTNIPLLNAICTALGYAYGGYKNTQA